ncbi:uncharacterized protein [Lolium perenne]|uniref:uncharacterized protein n=1 Tax=Lolium perenne TaxID=4522 RepID=UPI0021EB294F|nr:uncharacterized protein LOC127334746 [Lolium perenne]
MDDYRPRRSPATERFVGLFSSPSSSPTEPSFIAGDEFHEDDFMFSSSDAAAPDAPPDDSPTARVPHAHLGLLAALHDGDKRLLLRRGAGAPSEAIPAALLRRKATIAAAAASASSGGGSLSPTQTPASAAWAIPANPRPRSRAPAPQYHQSAPVKVPVRPPRKPAMDRWDEADDDDDQLRRGDAAMLPPHEMVARASAGGAGPVAPFSMLEGAGRTLKGRDLRRVRDAVLRQTGWLD